MKRPPLPDNLREMQKQLPPTQNKAGAAALLQCSVRTIGRYIHDGFLRASRPRRRGSSRVIIQTVDVLYLMAERVIT